MKSRLLKLLSGKLASIFEPARPRFAFEDNHETKTDPASKGRDNDECLEYLARAWRLHIVVRQRYREVPLAEAIDSFARWAVSDLVRNFAWVREESKANILIMIFAGVLRSGTHDDKDIRHAINEIAAQLVEDTQWPPSLKNDARPL